MAAEKKVKEKKKIGERASTILTETCVDAEDGSQQIITKITKTAFKSNDVSQINTKTDEIHDTKGDKTMTEGKTENQGAKWIEMMMGMNNNPFFTTSNKTVEPLIELTKMQQQSFMNMYLVWSDQLGKIGEASRSGDVKKVWETCMESNKEIFDTCQKALKEQSTAQYGFLRTFIPALPNFLGPRS
jgi:hypothetical protein